MPMDAFTRPQGKAHGSGDVGWAVGSGASPLPAVLEAGERGYDPSRQSLRAAQKAPWSPGSLWPRPDLLLSWAAFW